MPCIALLLAGCAGAACPFCTAAPQQAESQASSAVAFLQGRCVALFAVVCNALVRCQGRRWAAVPSSYAVNAWRVDEAATYMMAVLQDETAMPGQQQTNHVSLAVACVGWCLCRSGRLSRMLCIVCSCLQVSPSKATCTTPKHYLSQHLPTYTANHRLSCAQSVMTTETQTTRKISPRRHHALPLQLPDYKHPSKTECSLPVRACWCFLCRQHAIPRAPSCATVKAAYRGACAASGSTLRWSDTSNKLDMYTCWVKLS
jgi:hypothetical protein